MNQSPSFLTATPAATEQQRVITLLERGPEALAEALRLWLARPSQRLAEAALYVIGLHGDHGHAPALFAGLGDASNTIRRTAVEALLRILHRAAATAPVGRVYVDMPAPAKLPADRRAWCEAFRALLADPDPYLQARAAQALAWLDDHEAIPLLYPLLGHDNDVVRYHVYESLRGLTGQSLPFMPVRQMVNRRAPVATIGRGAGVDDGQTLSPFHLAPHLISQGKHQNLRGRPPRFATFARLWWQAEGLCLDIRCDDPEAAALRDDSLTIYLQTPSDPFSLHRLLVYAESGLAEWLHTSDYRQGKPRRLDEHAQVTVQGNGQAWTARLTLAWSAFGADAPPVGQAWGLNIVRREYHGWRSQISCWAHYYPVLADAPAVPRMGRIVFTEQSPRVRVLPDGEHDAPPQRVTPGDNRFTVEMAGGPLHDKHHATVRFFEGDQVVAQSAQPLQPGEGSRDAVSITLPADASARAVDVEVSITDETTGRDVYRACSIATPVVTPFARVAAYALQVIGDESALQRSPRSEADDWRVRDHGPMLMTEYHPVALGVGPDGVVYGGTFPGGRVYAYDSKRDEVRDLGSPCFPMNHTRNILVRADGVLVGAVNHNVFTIDPGAGVSRDLGEPMPREPYSEMVLTALRGDQAYGCHQGHLFSIDTGSGRVVNKGLVELPGDRLPFHTVIADSAGALLAAVGPWEQTRWRLARYRPESDTLLLSDFTFDGLLLHGPKRQVYLLCNDGRLFRWNAADDSLRLQARYGLDGTRVRWAALRASGELVVPRGSVRGGVDNVSVSVFGPGETPAVDLGNPVPPLVQMVGVVTAPDDTVFGAIGTQEVYGLTGGPIHLYSISRS